MIKITIEDIVFFIFIVVIVGTALWLLSGSPPEIDAIITIALAVIGFGIMLWKKYFMLDSKVAIGFIKVKHDMEKNHIEINNRFNKIENKLDEMNRKIK